MAVSGLVIGLFVFAFIMLACFVFSVYKCRQQANSTSSTPIKSGKVKPQAPAKESIIAFSDITLSSKKGDGELGTVWKAKWKSLDVACKEINYKGKPVQIVSDINLLMSMRHPNLVLLLGLSTPPTSKLYLVSELMERDLFHHLQEKSSEIHWKQQTGILLGVARAMNYLSSSKPPIIHDNLSSINVLITSDGVAKISDYGLGPVRMTAMRNARTAPPFWKAPENISAKEPRESTAADVYSFGIIFWEILMKKKPYFDNPNVNKPGSALVQQIIEGARPTCPQKTPPVILNILDKLWNKDPAVRTSFAEVLKLIEKIASEEYQPATWWSTANSPDESKSLHAVTASAPQPWMVKPSEVKLEELIGAGSFGQVFAGQFRGKKVAVKRVKPGAMSKKNDQ